MVDFTKNVKIKNFFIYIFTFLITYQIYFTFYFKKHLTAAFLLCFFISFLYLKDIKKIFKDKTVIVYIFFIISLALRGFFSYDKLEVIKYVLFLGSGILCYFVYLNSQIKKENIVLTLIISVLPMVIFMVYTYHNENLEFEILKHPLMKLFIEPNTLEDIFLGNFYPNIYEAKRVGGFFINANICSMFVGLNFILLFSLFFFYKNLVKKIFLIIFGVIFFISIIYTGSKGATVAFILSFGISGIIFILERVIVRVKNKIIFLIIFLLTISSVYYIMSKLSGRKSDLQKLKDFHGRSLIWKASLEVIKKNWLFGTGLSGDEWSKNYNPEAIKIGASENMPPHNMFLYVWGKAGIFSAGLLFIFFILKIFNSLRNFYIYHNQYSLAVFTATLWIFIQGMVENFVLMDLRISAVYWLIIALENRNGLS